MKLSRQVTLHAEPDEVWRLLTDDHELAAWFATEASLEPVVGGSGRFVEPDGEVRRAVVDVVDPGHRLGFTWWSDDRPGDVSTVTLTVEASPAGATLTVVEEAAGAGGAASCSVADAALWDDRLVGLELRLLSRLGVSA